MAVVELRGRTQVMAFESLRELEHFIETTPRVWRNDSSRSNRATNDWDLGVGLHGARALARSGWEDGVRQVAAAANFVPERTREKLMLDMAGFVPDVPRYCAGEPAHMLRKGKARAKLPVITLVVNTAASSGVPAHTLARYGGALVSAIDVLERSGVRVEVVAMISAAHRDNYKSVLSWIVKRAEETPNLADIAFSIAHPAMFRRLGFALIERTPRAAETEGYGYVGYGVNTTANLPLCDSTALIMPPMPDTLPRDPEQALQTVLASVRTAAKRQDIALEINHG